MIQPITPAEFLSRIQTIAHYDSSNPGWMDKHFDSIAEDHINADKLMYKVLESLGYSEGVQIFKEMTKWYD